MWMRGSRRGVVGHERACWRWTPSTRRPAVCGGRERNKENSRNQIITVIRGSNQVGRSISHNHRCTLRVLIHRLHSQEPELATKGARRPLAPPRRTAACNRQEHPPCLPHHHDDGTPCRLEEHGMRRLHPLGLPLGQRPYRPDDLPDESDACASAAQFRTGDAGILEDR